MTVPEGLVLLDTDVLIHLARADQVGQRIERDLKLSERKDRPLISVVTLGEARAFAKKLGWGETKRRRLDELVRHLGIVDIHNDSVLNRYAEIDYYSEKEVKPARPLGQNDMWIAACSSVYNAHLITSDRDFDHLAPRFLGRTRVNARTGVVIATTSIT